MNEAGGAPVAQRPAGRPGSPLGRMKGLRVAYRTYRTLACSGASLEAFCTSPRFPRTRMARSAARDSSKWPWINACASWSFWNLRRERPSPWAYRRTELQGDSALYKGRPLRHSPLTGQDAFSQRRTTAPGAPAKPPTVCIPGRHRWFREEKGHAAGSTIPPALQIGLFLL